MMKIPTASQTFAVMESFCKVASSPRVYTSPPRYPTGRDRRKLEYGTLSDRHICESVLPRDLLTGPWDRAPHISSTHIMTIPITLVCWVSKCTRSRRCGNG